MQRRTMITAAVAAAAAAGLLGWAFAPRPVEVETARAAVAPFESTLDEDARTRLAERYVVAAPLSARLARITLREGDTVAAGAPLATLLPLAAPLLDARSRAELQARSQAAEANLARAAARVAAAQVVLEQARSEQRRSAQLAQQGFVAATKQEADRLAVQAAEQELRSAAEGRHVAEHELQQAQAALGGGRGAAGQPVTVAAPVAGQVLRVLQPSEGPVAAGTPLLELGDLVRLEVVAEMLTGDALQARPGAPVRIERWGGPGELEGRVRRVEPAAFTKVSALGVEEQRVRVVIDIASPRAQWQALGDGFRVGVRLVTRREAAVLQVPLAALFPRPAAEGGGQAVFVVDSGRARLQPVGVTARSATAAWVSEGLAEGAEVIVYPGQAVTDGARVKPRRV